MAVTSPLLKGPTISSIPLAAKLSVFSKAMSGSVAVSSETIVRVQFAPNHSSITFASSAAYSNATCSFSPKVAKGPVNDSSAPSSTSPVKVRLKGQTFKLSPTYWASATSVSRSNSLSVVISATVSSKSSISASKLATSASSSSILSSNSSGVGTGNPILAIPNAAAPTRRPTTSMTIAKTTTIVVVIPFAPLFAILFTLEPVLLPYFNL